MADDIQEIKLPKLGESVTEGLIARWLKSPGETVEMDEPLFEVETDKISSEIPSPADGVLLEILVAEGQTVPVDTVVARLGSEAAAAAAGPAAAATGKQPAAGTAAAATGTAPAAPAGSAAVAATAPAPPAPPATPDGGDGRAVLSPIVRKLAADHGIDLAAVVPSGQTGRIRREDVEAAIAARGAAPAAALAPPPAPAAAAAAAPAVAAAPKAPPTAAEREEVVPLSKMRLMIAQTMLRSIQTSVHVWTSAEVDMERIDRLRQKHKDRFRKEEGMSLTYLPFIARATCDALRAFPSVNSSVDLAAQTMTLHNYVNLGISVDLNQQGLMAPVVKNAQDLNLRGLARGIRTVADKATARKLLPDDLTGSTFTITNPGSFRTFASAPIINQPNVAILSTEGVIRRPVAVGDNGIAVHAVMVLGLVYDHRAFDGATASLFVNHIKDSLENRDWEPELG